MSFHRSLCFSFCVNLASTQMSCEVISECSMLRLLFQLILLVVFVTFAVHSLTHNNTFIYRFAWLHIQHQKEISHITNNQQNSPTLTKAICLQRVCPCQKQRHDQIMWRYFQMPVFRAKFLTTIVILSKIALKIGAKLMYMLFYHCVNHQLTFINTINSLTY